MILRNLLGSIATKFGVSLAGLAAMCAAAVLVASFAFHKIDTLFSSLVENELPGLRAQSALIAKSDQLKDALTDLLLARNRDEVDASATAAVDTIGEAEGIAASLDPDSSGQYAQALETVRIGIDNLSSARGTEFAIDAELRDMVESLNRASSQAGEFLDVLAGEAVRNLESGANDKVNILDETLSDLVNKKFALIRDLLQIRAEINLATGTLIAGNETGDPALEAILTDLATAATSHLDEILPDIRTLGVSEETLAPIVEAKDFFQQVLGGRRFGMQPFRDKSLGHRQQVDIVLSGTIDDLLFELVIDAETASDGNREAIQGLLDDQLGRLRAVSALNDAVNAFALAAFQAAVAPDEADLANARTQLASASAELDKQATDTTEDVRQLVDVLQAAADENIGAAAVRQRLLISHASAEDISRRAADSVLAIAQFARAAGDRSIQDIADTGAVISAEIDTARARMQAITIGSVALVLATLLFVFFFIVRPLGALSRSTERLATGDMAPVGVARASGEIGRMVTALSVFRDNLIETRRLQDEEAARAQAEAEAAERAEAEGRARDDKERELAEQRDRERREMKEAQEAEREAHRKAADKERQRTEAAQNQVVSELAQALGGLAGGALDTRIATEFPPGYEQLRLDFNAAMDALERALVSVSGSSQTILGNASEITNAADDLSRRTESTAATLAETSSALAELTTAVQGAADGAAKADAVVRTTRVDAESNEEVVRETIAAMAEIAESSQRISRIIDVIDDIAFQTNLLALNAGVEAARAGDSGRGFAVVATEVRSLAQRSAEAAQEIGTLIRDSSDQVKRGVGLVDRTGSALQTIISGIGEITSEVSKIAASTSEQSHGIGEINKAVELLDRSTQQNAAMFEETTAATHSLNREARTLTELLSAFRASQNADPDLADSQFSPEARRA